MTNQFDTWKGVFKLDPQDGITEEAKIVFSQGQCHSLAVAIHELTGYPLYGAMRISSEPTHIFVKSPVGFLDIDGPNADRWFNEEPFPVTKEEIFNFSLYKPCNPQNAHPFAELVIQTYVGDTIPVEQGVD